MSEPEPEQFKGDHGWASDATPKVHARCEACDAWMWCRGQVHGHPRPKGCDALPSGERESNVRFYRPWEMK